jgi:hypothetical protein
MNTFTMLGMGAVCALTLSSCFLNATIRLTITNLQTPAIACAVDTTDTKSYLTLTFDYIGTVNAMRLGFTPYGTAGNKATEFVVISDVNTPPTGVKLPFPSSNKITVRVNLADVVIAPAGAVQAQGVTPPDQKVSLPMNVSLSASNANGEQAGPLTLNGVDVGGCYPTTAK